MSSITPRAEVPGIPRTPLPHGLFSASTLREGAGRWEGAGIEFDELGCPPSAQAVGAYDCANEDETGPAGFPLTFEGGLDRGLGDTFSVTGTYECSPIGNPLTRAEEVATQRLLVTEERLVEEWLWGTARPEAGKLPEGLASATPVDLVTDDLLKIIAAAEQAISDGYGSVGVIHLSRGNALLAIDAGALTVRNGKLVTELGTPAVAGSGYGDDLVIATPALMIYRSEVFQHSGAVGDLLDRAQNNLKAVAMRTYSVGMDSCGPWAFTITPTPAP